MAKAKDVYAKVQKDLAEAQKEVQALHARIGDAQENVTAGDKRIAALMAELLVWGERLVPDMFAEKTRIEIEVLGAIAEREQSLRSANEAYDEATKIYSDLYAAHTSFERAENNRMLTDPDYVSALNSINAYNEPATRVHIDKLTAQVEKLDKKLGASWLIRAAYHNDYGQDQYASQHFLQDLFGMLCLKVKKTERYKTLTRDIEYADETLAKARAEAYRLAGAASSASILVQHMRDATTRAMESHSQDSLNQRAKVDAAGLVVDREAQALNKEKARGAALRDWSHPMAKQARDKFQTILIEDSDAGTKLRAELSTISTVSYVVRNLMREVAQRSGDLLSCSVLEGQLKLLSNTIDKLESMSRDMRRKSLSSSSREIAKADDFMAGNSMDSGFDLSTLVAVAIVMDAVIDATPQDTSFSSSSNDSYSSPSFE
jgi:hypothetical protein